MNASSSIKPYYKAIVFDVGEVLIDWNPRYLYRKIFDDEREMEHFLEKICTFEWNIRQDAGYPWDAAIEEKVKEFPDYEQQIRMYKERWLEMVSGGVQGSVDTLYRLKEAGWLLYAITNYNHETFELSKEKWPFLKEFDGAVVSGEEKICKPDPKIYQILLERYQLKGQECIFIDDRAENIKAAEEQGMTGILFESPAQMRDDLIQLIGEF